MLVFIFVSIQLTAAVKGGILNPKVYSVQPGAQCHDQAQQAVRSIDWSSCFQILSTVHGTASSSMWHWPMD